MPRVVRFMGVAALCLIAFPDVAPAQSQMHPRWEIPGFDFRPNGGWRVKAGRVAAARRQLLKNRNFAALNAPMAQGPSAAMTTAVSGIQNVPALLFGYKNTSPAIFTQFPPSDYQTLLFSSTPLGSNPYTVRTFYEEMSNNLLSMQGQILGWVQLDSNEVFYTGTAGTCSGNPFGTTSCNGIFSTAAVLAMQNGMRAALGRVDPATSFGQFDNDGLDGMPNSGDDDGYVDMIMFAHATRDGACGAPTGSTNNHIWSHRFVLVNATQTDYQDYVTNDASLKAGFGNVRVSDYFMASGLGGTTSCDSTRIMPIGTAAHEFGHALGLPDLYDTGGDTEGIGQWGLMGSGNFTTPPSPSRMEAWSLNELGWVFVRPLTTPGTYNLGAAPVSDTAFFVNVQGANSRNESFLIENRQASQADTAVIRVHCLRSGNPLGCGGGLLIWHIDGTKVASSGFHAGNRVNTGPIFGVKLMQGDGLNQLNDPNATAPRRRGDAGDPYPGVSGNTTFSTRTNPAPLKNVDSSFAGFAIDSIRQIVPGGEMAFRLRFGALTVVQGSDPAAIVKVDGVSFNGFRDLLDDGSIHSISVDDPHPSADGRRRFHFVSWSDGQPRTHDITGNLTGGGTYTATLTRDFKVIATVSGSGTITPDTAIDLTAGAFVPEGRAVQLTAIASGGETFAGWRGDTSSSNPVLMLPMGRPYTVVAYFAAPVTTAAAVAQLLGPTAPLTPGQVVYLDARGNDNGFFDLGDFLAWVKATGAPLSPDVMAKLTAGKGGR